MSTVGDHSCVGGYVHAQMHVHPACALDSDQASTKVIPGRSTRRAVREFRARPYSYGRMLLTTFAVASRPDWIVGATVVPDR